MAFFRPDMCSLLSPETIEALNQAGIWTVNDLLSVDDLMELRQETNIRFHVLKEIHQTLKQQYTIPRQDLNFEIERNIETCKICPTGLPMLTSALNGGYQTQEVVEYFGDTECGKTEMCNLLCSTFLSHFEDHKILYIAANNEINNDKIIKYYQQKEICKNIREGDKQNLLDRIHLARASRMAELVHLLNTSIHSDRKNSIKCIIIDSLSFIIQEDIIEIKTSNLDDPDEAEKFSGWRGPGFGICDKRSTIMNERKYLIDVYLHEVMKVITQIAFTKNVIVVLTNSDADIASSKSWTNAIDHRIHLTKGSFSCLGSSENECGTIIDATITKTLHNISKIGYSLTIRIHDEGVSTTFNDDNESQEEST